jgi:hypothetical protein
MTVRRSSIAERAAAAVRPPSPHGRRGDRPLNNPQWRETFGRRKRGPKNIPLLVNGARLRDLVRLIEGRRRVGPDQIIRHRRAYLTVARHLCPKGVEVSEWLLVWAARHLPECPAGMVAKVAVIPQRGYTQDQLATALAVSFACQQRLKLWSFGACDLSRRERLDRIASDKKRRDRERATERRRAAGVKPRHEYEARSLSQLKPWDAAGMSRSKWFRVRGTGP